MFTHCRFLVPRRLSWATGELSSRLALIGMTGQEGTGYGHMMNGSNRETGRVLQGESWLPIRMRNILLTTKNDSQVSHSVPPVIHVGVHRCIAYREV